MSETTSAPMTMLDEVWDGLQREQKVLSSKYFYDERGSELFVRITRLPEYYPTRTERALLARWSGELVRRLEPKTLLELGAGSAGKTRLLLNAMTRGGMSAHYVPQDVSGDFLARTAAALREEYPTLEVTPLVGDLVHPLDPSHAVVRPILLAFLGSTIGNFSPPQAVEIMENVAEFLVPGDHFLLGADLRPSLKKSREELEAAYNDDQGVTAEFNRNLLSVLNTRLGSTFRPESFAHRAFYDEVHHRIEMHLVSQVAQSVEIPGRGTVRFQEGESVRTEISCKYDRETVAGMFAAADLELVEWLTDDHERYALAVGRLR